MQLLAVGPTMRFAVWFERAAEPTAFKTFKGFERDVPLAHPYALPHEARPAWLPEALAPASCLVMLPRLGSYLPVPLPGLISAWDLAQFKTASRTLNTSPYRVPAWLVPPSLSLAPLRKLLHDWSTRYGVGFVAPQAAVVLDVLDALRARLTEGPLLPALAPASAAWRTPYDAPTLPVSEAHQKAVWVPPVSLVELHRLDAQLRSATHLPASHGSFFDRRREREPATWTRETVPSRLAIFLLEVLGAAVERAGAAHDGVPPKAIREAVARGDVATLHRDHGSCLHPQHEIFAAPTVPKAHLHARLHPLEASDDAGNAWELELGLAGTDDAFLPLETLVAEGTLSHAAVEHDGAVWLRPASIVERDWRALVGWQPTRFAAPELLTGRARLTEAAGLALLAQGPRPGEPYEYNRWLEEIGASGRSRAFTAFSVAPSRRGVARVKVHWELEGEEEPSLHASRFTPRLEVAVGDATLLADDVERLVRESTAAFVRVHGRVVSRDDLAAALELVRAREKVLRRLDASRGVPWHKAVELDDAWSTERAAAASETVFAARWEAFLARLRDGAGVPQRAPPEGFRGALRPYQLRGLSWLSFVVDRGFGGCLADDMGLGKTVQVLALLALRRGAGSKRKRADLVVCPTAVVFNWAREAKRFTPGLRVHAHQGAGRAATADALREAADAHDVVVTSYALIRRDAALFASVAWGVVVADEAQNMKNPDALQTRAVKALAADAKLCLTGTPVENHLRDLWSIYDVALPGLLGGATRFAKTFLSPIRAGDARAMERLTRRVGPFLLRRTKRDPGVAADLPPKQEQETWCDLTREQVALYRAMTDATLEGIVGKDGVERRAHILTALMRFKQICNHPENFQRDKPAQLFGRSGKLDRAMELIGELLEGEQRVLVFTQFTEMGQILGRALDERFGVEADFYHGGLTAKAREERVAAFNDPAGPPVLILSLKAGGTGLNLTAASAVIHYDRWWNPAVEDQATDRAHRIGQTRKVNVYKFVTRATLEERIVTMLESKRELASKVLGASDESWLTEMDDRALKDFLSLGELAEEP